jgi:pimeloyl-ACP methyl ester carboxylesterase
LASCGSSAPAASRVSIGTVLDAPVRVVRTSLGWVDYRAVGHGPVLVMLMGLSGSIDAWDPRFVAALAARYRVVMPDNAGVGQTSPLGSPLSIHAMAEQTDAFLRALKRRHADILGWSMGGMVAQALAVVDPARVSKLVLAATLPGNGTAVAPSSASIGEVLHPGSYEPASLESLIFPPNQQAALHAYLDAIARYPHFAIAPPQVSAAQLGAIASWVLGEDPVGRRIDQIRAPTLIADGRDDALVPVGNALALRRAIRDSSVVLYPDAGHAFLFQDRGAFVARLKRFLG